MNGDNSREKSIALIVSAAIVAIAMGLGLMQVGKGFASRSNEGITVTGSARVEAISDKAVWPLNAEVVAPTQSVAVARVASAVE